MNRTVDDLTLRDHWRVIVRRRSIIVTSVVACVGVALALSVSQTPVYEASVDVLVQPRTSGSVFSAQTSTLSQALSERAIATEIQVIEGDMVRADVQSDLGMRDQPPRVSAAAVERTDVVRITARNSDPASAAALAAAYAESYIDLRRDQAVDELEAAIVEVSDTISDLDDRIGALSSDDPSRAALTAQKNAFSQTLDQLRIDSALRTGGAAVITPADIPRDPVAPNPTQAAILALLIGLAIGAAAAYTVDHFDDSIASVDDLAAITELPVLAAVPVTAMPDGLPVSVTRPGDQAVESFRTLRTNLQFLAIDRELAVVQVVSSIGAEGKTTVASNLAIAFATAGKRVILVDADLRRPRLHEMFDQPPTPGLSDVVLGASVAGALRTVSFPTGVALDVLVAGAKPPNPGELLSSQRFREVLLGLRAAYDVVVIDSAPVLPISDSIALSSSVDGLLVVAHAERVTRAQLSQTLDRLQRVQAPIVGIVVNQASVEPGTYGYGYGYAPSDLDEPSRWGRLLRIGRRGDR